MDVGPSLRGFRSQQPIHLLAQWTGNTGRLLFGVLVISTLLTLSVGLSTSWTLSSRCSELASGEQTQYDTPRSFCQEPPSQDLEGYERHVELTGTDFINCSQPWPRFRALEVSVTVYSSQPLQCSILLETPDLMVFENSPQQSDGPIRLVPAFNEELLDGGNNVMRFDLDVVAYGWGISALFKAVPACQNYALQAFCYSDNQGAIQTSNWDGFTDYDNDVSIDVTLPVPEGNDIMISAVSVELELTSDSLCRFDWLRLYKGPGCHGDYVEICRTSDLEPIIYSNLSAVCFKFSSDGSVVKPGFKILFSFHNSADRPEKLHSGKWNCSVPFWSDFEIHFLCGGNQALCEGSSGEVVRTPLNKWLCGGLGVDILVQGGTEYSRYPLSNYTWNQAAAKCASTGARLMDVRGAAKKEIFKNLTGEIDWKGLEPAVFVGLKMTSSTDKPMYLYTWMWTDEALAVDLDIYFENPKAVQRCVLMDSLYQYGRMSLRDTTCLDEPSSKTSFICEKALETEVKNDTVVRLPSPPARHRPESLTVCVHNHTAHHFLACDPHTECLAFSSELSLSCARTKFRPALPLFKCRHNEQYIPFSLVCDHRSDCYDASDEDFCRFPACHRETQFECADKKQCIPEDQYCDRVHHCVDESDEIKCSASIRERNVRLNSVPPPAVVNFTGDGNLVVTPLTSPSASCPETHFRCPGGSGYCMPVYVRCNDVNDCPGKEDEAGCEAYTCPGFYRCRKSRVCLHHDHLCDGVSQCPERDDELACGVDCSPGCTCYGHAFICTRRFQPMWYTRLRFLDAHGTSLTLADVFNNTLLVHLGLQSCGISSLDLVHLPNLQELDLSHNDLLRVSVEELSQFVNLRYLNLAFNPLLSLRGFFADQHTFPDVYSVNFAGVSIREVNASVLETFPNVRSLNLSGCGVDKVSETGFRRVSLLSSLDLRGCSVKTFHPGVFQGLTEMTALYADNYKLCCPSVLPEDLPAEKCVAPTDEVSSCDALLRSDVFRVFLSFYALLAISGNLGSFVYRLCVERTSVKMGYDIFVLHLSVADFLMGVYLAIIGVADRVYAGTYRLHDEAWKLSAACQAAGFLSLLSSEVSAFLICIITVERLLVIAFPLKNLRFRRWSAHVACLNLWLVGLLLAGVPLLPGTRHWEFYSQSGICVPLPVTRKEFPGREYSFAVMIVFNFVLFILIAVGQLLIYWSIKSYSVSSAVSSSKSKDMAIARRLLAVVMTDFLCWFPIGVLGVMARAGLPISSDVSVAMAIFVLPFNSALNPFLYTFNMVMEKRRAARQQSGQRKTPTKTTRAPATAAATRPARHAEAKDTNFSAISHPQADNAETEDTNFSVISHSQPDNAETEDTNFSAISHPQADNAETEDTNFSVISHSQPDNAETEDTNL